MSCLPHCAFTKPHHFLSNHNRRLCRFPYSLSRNAPTLLCFNLLRAVTTSHRKFQLLTLLVHLDPRERNVSRRQRVEAALHITSLPLDLSLSFSSAHVLN
ncbi:hypothetical protein KC19_10G044900 [Ceratodon purpureus]|uniref:Uncharacterized protein n=1 Tax=Ceratodon purpureus TaxID=3225 RepID=A0A8T0GGV0_CERPU|nr:hypothetical protein KC19_10G044900 [Ceratodon purpureus]